MLHYNNKRVKVIVFWVADMFNVSLIGRLVVAAGISAVLVVLVFCVIG
ncbi:MAG: hypothetical protein WC464_07715 [Bdellovibrionales bacterium]